MPMIRRPWRLSSLPSTLLIGALIALPTTLISAHGLQPVTPDRLWTDWSWEPLTLFALLSSVILYDMGVRTLWMQAGRGHSIRRWQPIAFKAGLIALFVALISPLDALSAVLFSAHMAQHLILIFVAAPLFVISAAPLALFWALPIGWRRWLAHRGLAHPAHRASILVRVWSTLTQPLIAWMVYAVALWIWHLPGLYQAALADNAIHALEHLSFLGASGLFWWMLIRPGDRRQRAIDYGIGVLYIATTALQSSILGALLVFSNQPWYPSYAANVTPWGITPLADQQLAGLIMWLPIGVVYLTAAAILVMLWLRAIEQVMQRREKAPSTQPKSFPLMGKDFQTIVSVTPLSDRRSMAPLPHEGRRESGGCSAGVDFKVGG